MVAAGTQPLSLGHVARLLRPAPLNLEEVSRTLFQGQSAAEIHAMAIRFLPPHPAEQVITAPTPSEAALRFAVLFDQHVFPLYLEYFGIDSTAGDLIDPAEPIDPRTLIESSIPCRPLGIDVDYELHELHDIAPDSLITVCAMLDVLGALAPEANEYTISESDALHTVWKEHLQGLGVPSSLLERIPSHGFPAKHFLAAVRKSAHQEAQHAVNYMIPPEHNVFLNWYSSSSIYDFNDCWTDENVAAGSSQWQQAKAVLTGRDEYLMSQEGRAPQQAEELLALLQSSNPAEGDQQP